MPFTKEQLANVREQFAVIDGKRGDKSETLRVGPDVELVWIPLSKLRVIHHEEGGFQRGPGAKKTREIIIKFNPAIFEPLLVARLPDETYSVIDGQRRRDALLEVYRGLNPLVACIERRDAATMAEQAEIFMAQKRSQQSINGYDHYKAQLVAQDPSALAFQRILAKHELKPQSGGRNEGTVACAAYTRINRSYSDWENLLDECLAIMREAWGRTQRISARMVEQLVSALNQAQKQEGYERDRFVRSVAILGYMRADALATKGVDAKHGEQLSKIYNDGRKSIRKRIVLLEKAA